MGSSITTLGIMILFGLKYFVLILAQIRSIEIQKDDLTKFLEYKHLLIGPIVLAILAVSRLILTFIDQ